MTAEDLTKATKNSPAVAFHKFVLLSKGRKNDLFCFFEGLDAQYYTLRVKQYVKRNYHPISCGNRQTVINTFNFFEKHNSYKSYRKAFFIDRDFENEKVGDKVFQTPCYSVENFYTNTATIKEILKNEFSLTEEEEAFKIVVKLFEQEFKKFNNESLLFNSWYAALKTKKEQTGKSCNVSLEEKLPKEFFVLKIGGIKSQYDLEAIKNKFPDALEVNDEEVSSKMNELEKQDLPSCLRGKYQMWFLYTFLKEIIDDANGEKKMIKKKTKFNIDKAMMISQLSQYAITPHSLIEYLEKFN